MSKTIILYGMRGTGKSYVGKELSEKLNCDFIDLDKYISKKNNLELSEFITKNGWDKFRDEENKCLKEVLNHPQPILAKEGSFGKIISLGGGTIVFDRNREELFKNKNTKIIYLNTSLKNISTRILKDEKSGDIRNSLTGKNVLEELKDVFEERKDVYKNNCDFEVDNNGKIEETVNQIINKLDYGGVCVPIISPHLTSPKGRGIKGILDIYEEIKNNRKIEFIELRVDMLFSPLLTSPQGRGIKILEKIIKECPKKTICTNRAKFEGGEFEGTCEESLDLLNKCLEFGADYIDIELETLERLSTDDFSYLKNLENNKLIISHHNFNKTPNIDFLKNILEKMGKYSPAVYKIAAMPKTKEDVRIIYELNNYFKENFYNSPIIPFCKGDENKEIYNSTEGFSPLNIFISMGKLGEETRVNLSKRGNLLTFGAYGDNISAPGQINYKELHKKIFTTKEVLFLGGPQISGSFSPFMHNFSSNKLKIEENKFIYKLNKICPLSNSLPKGERIAQDFVDKLESDDKYLGGNITMPYKIDIYNYLKKIGRLEKNAKMVGAVNTLYKKEGKIYGTNTDLEGISWPILEKIGKKIVETHGMCLKKIDDSGKNINDIYNKDTFNVSLQNLDIYILGAGGASRAAISASIKMGIKNIYVLNRSQKNLDEIKNHFEKFLGEEQKIITKIYNVEKGDSFYSLSTEGFSPLKDKNSNKSIIINTLPFGFKDNLPKTPIRFEELDKILPNLELYFEAVYDSEKGDTPIVEKILSTEIFNPLICRGVEMLIGQAKTGFELWSNGGEFRSDEITDILLKK